MRNTFGMVITCILLIAMILSFVPFESGSNNSRKSSKSTAANDYDSDSIVGDWEGVCYLTDSDNSIDVSISFNADGTYDTVITKESYVTLYLDTFKTTAESYNMDLEDYIDKIYGMSYDEFCDKLLDELDVDDLHQSGNYEINDTKLTLDGDVAKYELDGNKLTMTYENQLYSLERV